MASCRGQRTLALSSHVGSVLHLGSKRRGPHLGAESGGCSPGAVGSREPSACQLGAQGCRGGSVAPGALEPERLPGGRLCCCRASQVLQTLKGAGWAQTPPLPADIPARKDRTPACPAGALAWPTLERQLAEPLPASLRCPQRHPQGDCLKGDCGLRVRLGPGGGRGDGGPPSAGSRVLRLTLCSVHSEPLRSDAPAVKSAPGGTQGAACCRVKKRT